MTPTSPQPKQKESPNLSRPWRYEHCLNCKKMREDSARRSSVGNKYCQAYEDYLGQGVWLFVLKCGCKQFVLDPRRHTGL